MEAGILALQILVILAAGRCSMRIASCFLALFLLLRFSVLQQVSNLLYEALCKLGKVYLSACKNGSQRRRNAAYADCVSLNSYLQSMYCFL